MNTQEIFTLLDKYYNGDTSEEEESYLRKYFSGSDIPPGLEAEKEIFSFYSKKQSIPVPSPDFEKRIIKAVDSLEENRSSFVKRRALYTFISSAAAILMLIGSYFLIVHKSEPADTFSDPALAYAETLRILYSVSENLNNGIDALEPIGRIESTASRSLGTITRSTSLFEDNLRSLGYFEKAMIIVYSPLEISIKK